MVKENKKVLVELHHPHHFIKKKKKRTARSRHQLYGIKHGGNYHPAVSFPFAKLRVMPELAPHPFPKPFTHKGCLSSFLSSFPLL